MYSPKLVCVFLSLTISLAIQGSPLKNLTLDRLIISEKDSTQSYNTLELERARITDLDGISTLIVSYKGCPTPLREVPDLCINASVNQLTEIPAEIGNMPSIKKLVLQNNEIKKIPATLGKLVNLKKLYLDDNHISELPYEIGKLKKLTTLDVAYNRITALPKSIWQLTHLTHLRVSHNQLNTIPAKIVKLINLEDLRFQHNCLTSLPTEIGNLKKLQSLFLGENKLENLPASIGQLKKLQFLSLDHNRLQDLPASIGKLQHLEELWLFGNELTTLPVEFAHLKNLKSVIFSSNFEKERPLLLHLYGKAQTAEIEQRVQSTNNPLQFVDHLITTIKHNDNLTRLRKVKLSNNNPKLLQAFKEKIEDNQKSNGKK